MFRLIPGRLRIEVAGLRRSSRLAGRLTNYLSSVKGIREVTANPLTGRILVLFDYQVIDFPQLKAAINTAVSQYRKIKELSAGEAGKQTAAAVAAVPVPVVRENSHPGLYMLTTGGVLAAIVAKRIVVGKSPLASSQRVFNLAALTTIVSGYPLFRSGLQGLIRHKRLNHDLIIFMASLLLLAMRESLIGLSVLWVVHLTNFFHFMVLSKARAQVAQIMQQKQQVLYRLENEHRQKIRAQDVRMNDILALHSGEMVPVEGQVIAGQAGINRAAVSGDCLPYWVAAGDTVKAGSFLETGSLQIRVLNVNSPPLRSPANDSRKYEENRHINDQYVSKVMWWSLAAAGLLFLVTRDVVRCIAVLLAGSPAAISLARNSALGAAIAQATAQNIYIKEPRALETAGEADTVIWDKTGTLTEAVPDITAIVTCGPRTENEILAYAAAAGQRECHPYSKVLTLAARRRGLELPAAVGQGLPGLGVRTQIADQEVAVGNQAFMRQERILFSRVKAKITRLERDGNTVIYVAADKKICGLIAVRDKVKAASGESVAALRCMGIDNIALLSGDAAPAAAAVAATLDIPHRYGGVLPAEKARMIQALKRQKYKVIMVGDGINDSQALAVSDVGIAMGEIGAGPTISKADIVIGDDDPRKIAGTIGLGKQLNEVVRQNIALAAGLNIIGIALAAARFISPLTAGLLVNISTLGVILNSGRLFAAPQAIKSAAAMDLQLFAMRESLLKTDAGKQNEKTAGVSQDWPRMSPEAVCEALNTSAKFGISNQEADRRRMVYGSNRLAARAKPSFWRQLLDQFKDFMVQVLLGAAALSFLLGKSKNAMLTVGIVAANAILGVVQERKAGRSLDALQELAAPQARVIRAGRTAKINASNLVPGDVIVLEAGDRVPADARLLTGVHFEVEEASLTGETVPVKKQSPQIEQAEVALGDQKNMVFMGTTVTRGRAAGVVVATGMATEMGKIASLMEEHQEEPTPLQRRLEELGKYLVYGCLGVSGLVFCAGILRGERMINMLQTGASLAVAAIPEGLSAIVLIALAMGVQRMSKRNIIVRKLSSIETLGSATVICSDKTGTLTQNQMTVREVFSLAGQWAVSGEGYNPTGKFRLNNQFVKPNQLLKKIATIAVLCNNARLMKAEPAANRIVPLRPGRTSGWTIDGDPTEGALLALAAKAGVNIKQLTEHHCRVIEHPFEAERRMMSVLCTDQSQQATLYAKGAPDRVLSLCTRYTDGEKLYPLTDELRQKIERANDTMAAQALRVLACAYRPMATGDYKEPESSGEEDLIFCGLVGMIDPPRPEVPAAIAKCRQAGVKVVMITGDHPGTARAIGKELGLLDENGRIMTGGEIDHLTDDELKAAVETARIFARTSPHHKLRIVKAFRSRGEVVAMTGDGVNDAPAVKTADIGIAMGITGTDVTKEAACLTLADDNFATIVKAMEEGRSIYANIRKAIRYLVATNVGEVVLMLLAAVLGMPLPLIPIQLLWINLVGDGLPAIALVNDPPPADVMKQAPQSSSDSVFANGLGRKILSRGLIIGVSSLLFYAWKLRVSGNIIASRTLVLAELAISQFIHIFDCRLEKGMGKAGLVSNKWLLAAVALSMGMVVGVIHWPVLQPVFGTVSLSLGEWLLAFLVAAATSGLDFWAVGKIKGQTLPRRPRLAVNN